MSVNFELDILFTLAVFIQVYHNHTESVWSSVDREPKICTSGMFSAEYMVDGLSDTFWQSSSRNRLYASEQLGDDNRDTVIQLDLLQVRYNVFRDKCDLYWYGIE